MATLQAKRQWSATTAKSRLKQMPRERPAQPGHTPELSAIDDTIEVAARPTSVPPSPGAARAYHERLPELEQRQLLLQTVAIYPGWQLVSIQHRPESDVLVAYLIPSRDNGDPVIAIRQGRAMQIIMDATGDLRIQRPRRKRGSIFARCLRWLASAVGGSVRFASV
jgi:hypothetical protein